jgi:hypothetical protein
LPLIPVQPVKQQRHFGMGITWAARPDAFEIGSVKRDDIRKLTEILWFDLAGNLPFNRYAMSSGSGDSSWIGRAASVVGRCPCRIDYAFNAVTHGCCAKGTFGHR